jgi:hypothetical protein
MACERFNNFPQKLPGVSLVDAAMSRLLISSDMEEELSINFQNVIKVADRLEENVAKLGHWVGMYNTEHQE